MAEKEPVYDSEDEDDILTEAKAAFAEAQDAESENRDRFLEDIQFARMGEQWPADIAKQRREEGRPMLRIGRLQTFIRQVVNDSRQNKPSMRARPVDSGADTETAEIINGVLRHIEYNSGADIAYDSAIDNAVSGGFGYWRIGIDYAHDDTFDMDLSIIECPDPLAVYADPYANAKDGSDWMSAFVTVKHPRKRFEKLYKGADPVDFTGAEANPVWATADEVMVAEYWKRSVAERKITMLPDGTIIDIEQLKDEEFRSDLEIRQMMPDPTARERVVKTHKVKQCILTGAEVLEERDWPGRYIPIVPVYGDEVNEGGKRHFYSLIHFAKDAQTLLNIWRTAGAELTALAPKVPFIGPEEAFTGQDADKWAVANTKSYPYISFKGQVAPVRQQMDGTAMGAMQQAMMASDDIKSVTGIYDASLGAKGNETSGRAILARQREGDVSTFHFIDNLSRSIRHSGRILIDLIPHVWKGERIARLLGEDGHTVTEQPVNQPVPVLDDNGEPQMEPDPSQLPDPMTGQQAMRPVTRVYDLTAGKYDLTVSAGPSFSTKREEAATQMMELVRIYPDAAPVIGDLLASNLDWPGADEIADRLKKMLPAQLQDQAGGSGIPPEVQQQIEEGMARLKELEAENQQLKADKSIEAAKLQSDQQAAEQDRQIEAAKFQAEQQAKQMEMAVRREELKIAMFEAETGRMEAEAKLIVARKPTPAPATTKAA